MQLPELNQRLVLPAVSSSYPTLGAAYRHGGYEVDHENCLVRTGKDYFDSKAEIPEGFRISTAGEELAMQLNYEIFGKILKRTGGDKHIKTIKQAEMFRSIFESHAQTEREKEAIRYVLDIEGSDALIKGSDPRKAKVFDDLFGRGPDEIYMWQWTETGLRVPKGWENGRYDNDANGYPRIVLIGDKELGEMIVPEGRGRLVAEWDEVFGVPRVTIENQDWPHKPYTTHFWFNATPNVDDISGHYDVAIERSSGWHRDVGGRCLLVSADFERSLAGSYVGFRPVRGSTPEIEKEIIEKKIIVSQWS